MVAETRESKPNARQEVPPNGELAKASIDSSEVYKKATQLLGPGCTYLQKDDASVLRYKTVYDKLTVAISRDEKKFAVFDDKGDLLYQGKRTEGGFQLTFTAAGKREYDQSRLGKPDNTEKVRDTIWLPDNPEFLSLTHVRIPDREAIKSGAVTIRPILGADTADYLQVSYQVTGGKSRVSFQTMDGRDASQHAEIVGLEHIPKQELNRIARIEDRGRRLQEFDKVVAQRLYGVPGEMVSSIVRRPGEFASQFAVDAGIGAIPVAGTIYEVSTTAVDLVNTAYHLGQLAKARDQLANAKSVQDRMIAVATGVGDATIIGQSIIGAAATVGAVEIGKGVSRKLKPHGDVSGRVLSSEEGDRLSRGSSTRDSRPPDSDPRPTVEQIREVMASVRRDIKNPTVLDHISRDPNNARVVQSKGGGAPIYYRDEAGAVKVVAARGREVGYYDKTSGKFAGIADGVVEVDGTVTSKGGTIKLSREDGSLSFSNTPGRKLSNGTATVLGGQEVIVQTIGGRQIAHHADGAFEVKVGGKYGKRYDSNEWQLSSDPDRPEVRALGGPVATNRETGISEFPGASEKTQRAYFVPVLERVVHGVAVTDPKTGRLAIDAAHTDPSSRTAIDVRYYGDGTVAIRTRNPNGTSTVGQPLNGEVAPLTVPGESRQIGLLVRSSSGEKFYTGPDTVAIKTQSGWTQSVTGGQVGYLTIGGNKELGISQGEYFFGGEGKVYVKGSPLREFPGTRPTELHGEPAVESGVANGFRLIVTKKGALEIKTSAGETRAVIPPGEAKALNGETIAIAGGVGMRLKENPEVARIYAGRSGSEAYAIQGSNGKWSQFEGTMVQAIAEQRRLVNGGSQLGAPSTEISVPTTGSRQPALTTGQRPTRADDGGRNELTTVGQSPDSVRFEATPSGRVSGEEVPAVRIEETLRAQPKVSSLEGKTTAEVTSASIRELQNGEWMRVGVGDRKLVIIKEQGRTYIKNSNENELYVLDLSGDPRSTGTKIQPGGVTEVRGPLAVAVVEKGAVHPFFKGQTIDFGSPPSRTLPDSVMTGTSQGYREPEFVSLGVSAQFPDAGKQIERILIQELEGRYSMTQQKAIETLRSQHVTFRPTDSVSENGLPSGVIGVSQNGMVFVTEGRTYQQVGELLNTEAGGRVRPGGVSSRDIVSLSPPPDIQMSANAKMAELANRVVEVSGDVPTAKALILEGFLSVQAKDNRYQTLLRIDTRAEELGIKLDRKGLNAVFDAANLYSELNSISSSNSTGKTGSPRIISTDQSVATLPKPSGSRDSRVAALNDTLESANVQYGDLRLFQKPLGTKPFDSSPYAPHKDGMTGVLRISAFEAAMRVDIHNQLEQAGLADDFPGSKVLAVRPDGTSDGQKVYQVAIENIQGMTLDKAARNIHLSEADYKSIRAQIIEQQKKLIEHGLYNQDVKDLNIVVRREPDGRVIAQMIDLALPSEKSIQLYGDPYPLGASKFAIEAVAREEIDEVMDKIRSSR